jgi:hypothetical protein
MITLRELFRVTWTITKAEICVRDAHGKLLHEFYLGEGCAPADLPPRAWQSWSKGTLTASGRRINGHGSSTRYGPEMGWGLLDGAIPKELLDAEVTHLSMRCPDMIRCCVSVDVFMQELTLDMVLSQFAAAKDG